MAVVVAAIALNLFYANRQGGAGAPPVGSRPSPEPTLRAFMWPQTTLAEIQDAQDRADAGDPDYTWQVDPQLQSGWAQPTEDTQIVARFLHEVLGWERFRFSPVPEDGFRMGASFNNAFIRCAPAVPDDTEACAPSIDGIRYERVSLDLGQLIRTDASGVWVVTGWRTLPHLERR